MKVSFRTPRTLTPSNYSFQNAVHVSGIGSRMNLVLFVRDSFFISQDLQSTNLYSNGLVLYIIRPTTPLRKNNQINSKRSLSTDSQAFVNPKMRRKMRSDGKETASERMVRKKAGRRGDRTRVGSRVDKLVEWRGNETASRTGINNR
jgi:hypothetical protein